MKVRGDRRAGPSARRHLLFDQHRGDQVLGLVSEESAEGRFAGLTVWDRPDMPLPEVIARYEKVLATPPGPERDRLTEEFDACCAQFGATRLFIGKNRGRDATLGLSDARGASVSGSSSPPVATRESTSSTSEGGRRPACPVSGDVRRCNA